MANNKDFKVKNGIQPTVYHEGLGTVVSSSVTNYYVPPATSAGFDSFSATAQVGQNGGIAIGNSNAKLYLGDVSGRRIYQYSLSPADDLSSASYDSRSLDVSARTGISLKGITFKPDGSKVVFCGSNITPGGVFSYSLSTNWDIQSGTYDGNTSGRLDSYSDDTTPTDVAFNDDGTKLYVCGLNNNSVYEYTLSSAYVVGSGSLSHTFSVASQVSDIAGVDFNADGTKMFVACQTNNLIYTYNLSTGYDLSTASYSGETGYFGVGGTGLSFNSDGSKYYVFHTNETAYSIPSTSTTNTNTLDLSTGSVFEITPTSDIQIGLSNPAASGTVSQATLLLDGATASSYNTVSDGTVSAQGYRFQAGTQASPTGLFIKPDGLKAYSVDGTSDSVYQYTITTAWDLSAASYDSVNFSVSSQATNPQAVFFKSDGTEMYVSCINTNKLYQYTLSTAWDVSTASYSSNSLTFSESTQPYDFHITSDGTKLYIITAVADRVYQYTMSTAWNLSTASYDSKSFDVSGQDTAPQGVTLSADGTRMIVAGDTNNTLFQYTLSTAFDVSTASYDSVSLALGFNPDSIEYGNDGGLIYIVNAGYGYTVDGLSSLATITYDTTLEFAGGTAPTSPAIGETDVITISTRDGGTSYQAVQAINGAK